tara:strand:+ start:129 stop:593 length:465 start_codon:yes stop_codon:yes gene_type:complete
MNATEADKELEHQIREIATRALWDTVMQDIENNKFDKLLSLIKEIRDDIISFIPSRKDLHTEIEEKVDIVFIKQQLEHNTLSQDDFLNLFLYLAHWIRKLQAPADDEWFDAFVKDVVEESKQKEFIKILPLSIGGLNESTTRIKGHFHNLTQDS